MKRYWLRHKKLVLLSALLIIISSLAQVLFDFAKGFLLDAAVEEKKEILKQLGLALFLLLILKSYTFYGFSKYIKFFSVESIADMRQGIFTSFLKSSYPHFLKRKTGQAVSLYTNQLGVMENSYFYSFFGSFQIIASLLMCIIGLFYISWELALLSLLLLIPPIFAPRLLKHKLAKSLEKRMDSLERSTGDFSQWMDAKDVIENYQAKESFQHQFHLDTSKIQKRTEKYNALAYLSHSLATLLSQLGLFALIAFCAYGVSSGKFSIGVFLTAMALMQEAQGQVIYQAGYMQQIMSSKVASTEILSTIDEVVLLPERVLKAPIHSICFKDICFSYTEERKILKNFNLQTKEKGLYLIQGESGSGKSTAMNLLAAYYKPDKGSVSINDIPTAELSNLAEHMTILRQESVFFKDTLRNNLSMYQDVKEEDIIRLMKKLGLDKYANKESLEMVLSPEGSQFSGGEARRLSLIRSLLKPSEILILDEPLANVDEVTIHKIIHIIKELKDRYIFMISHQIPDELKENALEIIFVDPSQTA